MRIVRWSVSDSQFYLPLADVREEVARLATVHQNECAPLGAPSVAVVLGGTHATWSDGSYLECQEAPAADGSYAIRVRWWRPGMASPEQRCWRLSPWCAPADSVAFLGELVKGAPRQSVGELTWAEVRDAGLSCDMHKAPRVWCGCRAGQGGLSTAEALGVSGDWAEVMERDPRGGCTIHGPVCDGGPPDCEQAETVSAPPAQAGAAPAKGGSVGLAGDPPAEMVVSHASPTGYRSAQPLGLSPTARAALEEAAAHDHALDQAEGFVDASVDLDLDAGVVHASPVKAPAMPPPTRAVVVREIRTWAVRCQECSGEQTGEDMGWPPEPDCQREGCEGVVELLVRPDVLPNARGLETIRKAIPERHVARSSSCACQVCHGVIQKGQVYFAPPRRKGGGISATRRVHALCLELEARAQGPV